MHRRRLLALLEAYRGHPSCSSRERVDAARIEDFVRRNPDCFSRSLVEGHVTASAWLLDHDQAHCLLVHHRKLGRWLQPGGHADGDPDVLAVALREAEEESGIEGITPVDFELFDVDIHEIPATEATQAHLHYDLRFLLVAPAGATPVVSAESFAVRWFTRAEAIAKNEDASVLRLAEKWRRRFAA